MTIGAGTPLWANGFGCITWVGHHMAGVYFLRDGEPKLLGTVPREMAEVWAESWLVVQKEDGRIETVV